MERDRRLKILRLLGGPEVPDLDTKRLCEVCATVTEMTGAGMMLMSGDVSQAAVCTSNSVSAVISDLQFELGEGPCVDAFRLDRPVLVANLADPAEPRWMAFAAPAVAAGVRAIFAFPLQVGAVRLGVLSLYRDEPGPLGDDQHADALVMADVAAQALLVLQANAVPGTVSAELAANADFRTVVHQATGMIAAQLKVSVGEALARIRAYAFGNEQALTEVAQQIVTRQLRFDTQADVDGAP